MKNKTIALTREDWEAILAQPHSRLNLTLGKLFLLNKKFVKEKYGFTHLKGQSITETLKFWKEFVIPEEFYLGTNESEIGDISLQETKMVSDEFGIEHMNETKNISSVETEYQTESEVGTRIKDTFQVDAIYTKKVAEEEEEGDGIVTKASDVATSGMFNMEELKNSLCGIVLPLGVNSDEKMRKVNEVQFDKIMKFTSLFDCNGFCSIKDYAEMLQFACDAYKQRKCVKQSRTPFSLLLLLVKTVVVKSIHDEQNRLKEEHLQIRVNTMKDLIEAEITKDTSLLQSNSLNIELYVRAFVSVNFGFAFFETSNGPIKFKQLFGGNIKRSAKTAQNNCKDLKYVEGNEVMVTLLKKLHVL